MGYKDRLAYNPLMRFFSLKPHDVKKVGKC